MAFMGRSAGRRNLVSPRAEKLLPPMSERGQSGHGIKMYEMSGYYIPLISLSSRNPEPLILGNSRRAVLVMYLKKEGKRYEW